MITPERKEELQRQAERIARELLQDNPEHADCTLKLVILEGGEAIVSCKHCQVLGPDQKVTIWG